jgi:hypothetical protein
MKIAQFNFKNKISRAKETYKTVENDELESDESEEIISKLSRHEDNKSTFKLLFTSNNKETSEIAPQLKQRLKR